jgi:hypothetical protein
MGLPAEKRYMGLLSYDGRATPETVMNLTVAILFSNKSPVFSHTWGGTGASWGRTLVFKGLREHGKGRGFLIDYDIVFPATSLRKLVDAMKEADDRHLNIVSPYWIPKKDVCDPMKPKDGFPSYFHKDGTAYSLEEIWKLKDWQRVEMAGLGFYYGDLDPSYEFREQVKNKVGGNSGEDFSFFVDNKIVVNHVNFNLSHLRLVQYIMPPPPTSSP